MSRATKILLFLWLCIIVSSTYAQSYTQAEYFIDSDPGIGNATPISFSSTSDSLDLNIVLPSSGLALGSHQLYIRFKDTADHWCLAAGQSFTITDISNTTTAQLISGEYFFDTDPGMGNGTAFSSFSPSDSLDLNLMVNTSSLALGTHSLYYRFIDSYGNWGHVEGKTFSLMDTTNGQAAQLISGEYFFDTDPGIGNGTAFSGFAPSDSLDLNLMVNTSSLSLGAHSLYYRFIDSDGNWGHVEGKTFSITDTTNGQTAQIISGEYFFDTDPGMGNGTAISSISGTDSLDLNTYVAISGLSEGAHQLFYRFLDSHGEWGQIEGKTFSIVDSSNAQSAQIVGGEYFIDTDLGVGNGTAIPNFSSSDSLNLTTYAIPSALSNGKHYIHYRFYDSKGFWGQIATDSFDVISCIMPVANFYVSDVCSGDSVFFIDSSSQVDANASYKWDVFNNQSNIDTTYGSLDYGPITAGNYSAKLIIDNGLGCLDTIVKSYSVYALPSVNIGADTSICHGDSLTLNAGSFTSYLWSDNSNASTNTVSGTNTYWVEVTDSNQCSAYDSLVLAEFPVVTITTTGLSSSYCVNNSASILTATPQGGVFSGVGIIDSLFYPNIAGVGLQMVFYQYTDTNSCVAIDTVQTTVYALPIVSITTPIDTNYCTTGDSIQIVVNPTGGVFSGTQLSSSNYLNLNMANVGLNMIIYQYTDANSCTNADTVQTTIYANPSVNFTGLAASYCSNDASVLLLPNILGGSFQGSGMTGNTFIPSNAQAGTVSITYSYMDSHMCTDSTTYTTTVNHAPAISSFTATPNSFISLPFASQFSPNVSNPSDYNWKWYFGDGGVSTDSTPTHQYFSNGQYTVSLATQDKVTGCSDTTVKLNYINCSGAAPCNLGAAIWHDTLSAATICAGDSFLLNAGTFNAANTYQWLRNGIVLSQTNSSDFYAKQAGYYQVIISNGSCMDVSSIFFLNHYAVVQPIIQQAGTLRPCTGDSIKIFSPTSQPNYLWSTGETTSEIYVKSSGYYTLSVANAQGCLATSQPLIINASALPIPALCRVSVDSVSGYNKLSWNNNSPLSTDSFRIYREGYIYNQFDFIASVASSGNTTFTDYSSLPKNRYYRYRISAVDSCGVETPMSSYHKSINLSISAGLNNSWNLVWNHYTGRATITYQIYRGQDSTQMQLLTQLPSSIHSYTDFNAAAGGVYYLIKAVFKDSCVQIPTAPVFLTTLSNLMNTSEASGVGIEPQTIHKETGSITVFPNPNNGQFNLKFINIKEGDAEVEVFDAMGRRVYFGELSIIIGVNQKLNLQNLAKGIYIIRLSRKGQLMARKMMIIQ